VIGITVDNRDNTAASTKYEVSLAYPRCVALAGAVPVLLPHEPGLAQDFIRLCDGIILTGGVDPQTEGFGEPTHPQAHPMDPTRQAFELALLAALDRCPHKPALGVCLGMQLMALHNGGHLHQHLPDVLQHPQLHENDHHHSIQVCATGCVLSEPPLRDGQSTVVSYHHQAVKDTGPGPMRVVATAPDSVIEAIDLPGRPFYLGVQWHPERGGDGPLNRGLISGFVQACRFAMSEPQALPRQLTTTHQPH